MDEFINEETFLSVRKELDKFRQTLSEDIIKKTYFSSENDCYLVEEKWYKELLESFKEYDNGKSANKFNENFNYIKLLPEYDSEYINDFSVILEYLKKNVKLKLVSRKFLELIYDEESLENDKYMKYYSGNNKLIIEYKENISNKALLIIDPLNFLKDS